MALRFCTLRFLVDVFCLAWLVPICILLYLNFTGWEIGAGLRCRSPGYAEHCNLWEDAALWLPVLDKEDHEILGMLQIVAKALEVWFALVICNLIRDLASLLATGNSGLPMGHFMAAVRFNDITTILSPAFWTSAALTEGKSRWSGLSQLRVWAFVIFLASACIACNLMGPATAVLVLPTLGWSEYQNPTSTMFLESYAPDSPNWLDDLLATPENMTDEEFCSTSEMQAGNYTCMNGFYDSLNLMSAGLQWIRREDFNSPRPLVSYYGVTFTLNQSSEYYDRRIDWMPNRYILLGLAADYEKLEMSKRFNQTYAMEVYETDSADYKHYRNSLDVRLDQVGPTFGISGVCNRGNVTEFNISPSKTVRCFMRPSVSSPEYLSQCIRVATVGSDWKDAMYSHLNFTIGAGTSTETTVNVYGADNARWVPSGKEKCTWDPEDRDCDWDKLLNPASDPDDWRSDMLYYVYNMTKTQSEDSVVVCYTDTFLGVADYTFNYSPSRKYTGFVDMQLRSEPEPRPIYVHSDWALAAWSTTRDGTVDGNHTVAVNLVSSLKSILTTPGPKSYSEEDTDAFWYKTLSWFDDQHFDEEKEDFLIVMDYVPGDTLENVWKTLTDDQRASACHQLAGYLAQLRKLTGDHIRAINDGPICFGVYQTRWGGPFKSEREFNTWLVRGNHDAAKYGLTDNHVIHFAHADLSPRNVMVDETGHITGIIDWEWAGWYPEYWDVVRMISDKPGKRLMLDYGQHLDCALGKDKYQVEYKALLNVMRRFEDIFSGGIEVQPPPQPPSS